VAIVLMVTMAFVAWEAITWPNVGSLATRAPSSTAFIDRYRALEREAGRTPRVQWTWVPYGRIATSLKRAVVVAEDASFFSHRGFATAEIRDAIDKAVREFGLPRGASTISQQLAKNLWLSPSRNPLRKAKEAMLTWQLEKALTKRRILEIYLNVVEFGPGIYGAEAASRRYFGKSAADLGEAEAAELAAALPRPVVWHPGVRTNAYRRYVEDIRRRMERIELPTRLLSGGAPKWPPIPPNVRSAPAEPWRSSSSGGIDQSEAAVRIVALAEIGRRLHEDDLERRPHARGQEMAAARLPVGEADHDVRVDLGRVLLIERDVADE
jgi:monofunctional biosynthetic peptidoglycan transglycosylase